MINLLKGELVRLYKYKIILTGLFLSVIWIVIVALSSADTAKMVAPLLIWADASMMSILFVAASFYFEKQEATIKSVLVAPVSISEILVSKVIASLLMGTMSGFLVIIFSIILYGIDVQVFLLLLFILIVIGSHVAIGFVITFFSKDFGAMIVNYFLYALVAMIPSLLLSLGVIPEKWNLLMLISPSHCAQILINSGFSEQPLGEILWSVGYLLAVGFVLYPLVVYKKYKKIVIEG
jgi:fluoroquinolone transport system permease protein